jgi:Ca2+-binding EF-hand superfamily protein
LASDFVDY